ncbi:hypothetical protein TUN199_12075, partial [Pyrenophora tritici-repentis]
AHKAWFAKDPRRARKSFFRIGGIGSMMAVFISASEGTSYYHGGGDDGAALSHLDRTLLLDDPRPWRRGFLKTSHQLYVGPGDFVFFLAGLQLHKLDVETMFALWTDKIAIQVVKPSKYQDVYTVELDEDDQTDEDKAY